ncbi:MAG: hypothetical protein COB02_09355 [Candidatus Cloacimonadota bacterium]|nr:MAG: hypothetical protein COB02_09355 [Candidatus Cloacimonadota bacterium]
MTNTFYNLTNDILFKLTFGDPNKTNILISLINALLQLQGDKKILEVEILNPFNDKEFIGDKLSIVDIKAKDGLGILYNIEMQVPKHWKKRALYYASKLYTSQLEESYSYNKLNKTISISILNETCFTNNNEIHNIYTFHNTKSLKPLDDLMQLHFIELSKFNKNKATSLSTPFEKWLYALKHGDNYQKESDMLPKELITEDGIKEAFQAMRYANSDKQTLYLLEARQKYIHDQITREEDIREEGVEFGIQKGRKEGVEFGIQKIILNLIQNSTLNNTEISKMTSVDIQIIDKLRNS